MNLTILGCGTILQSETSDNCSGYLLNHALLFDCGPGIWKSLNQHRISLNQVNDLFLSHFHVDHTSDLGPLMLNRYLLTEVRKIPLNIIGPIGLRDWFSDLKKILGRWADDLSINLIEISDKPYQIRNYVITSKNTGHTENSICYRVDNNQDSFFYSGDSGFSTGVISLASNCQLAVLEASNTDKNHIDEHLTPSLAGKIASQAGVKKLVLTHMYPDVLGMDPLKETSSYFSGEIILAREGMTIDF